MKKHIWIPVAGAALLAVAMMGRPSVEAPSPKVHDRPERQRLKERQASESRSTVLRASEERVNAQVQRTLQEAPTSESTAPAVSPPSWVENDSVRMRVWLLSMTDAELARVVGTPQMHAWVSLGHADLWTPTEEPSAEMGEFLDKLNVRILAVQVK